MEKMDELQIEKLQHGILPETVKDKYTEAVVNQNIIAENGELICTILVYSSQYEINLYNRLLSS